MGNSIVNESSQQLTSSQRYYILAVVGEPFPILTAEPPKQPPKLRDQGKYEQAEEIRRQVLGLQETALGVEHPETMSGMANFGIIGRFTHAKRHF